jgi:hypothetical protein
MIDGLEYFGVALEVALVAAMLLRGRWKKYFGLFLYALAFLSLDAIVRLAVRYSYGPASVQYYYVYWFTDVALTLGAFLLVCAFFRRAFAAKKDRWSPVRTSLISVFVLVTLISCLSILRNYHHLFSAFTTEFSQNLYFACLVLITVLYVLLQQTDRADDDLSLLVSGLGIEFAGPAAGMALYYLTPGWHDVLLPVLIMQLCNLGMFATWLYAVSRTEEKVAARSLPTFRPVRVFAEAPAHGAR